MNGAAAAQQQATARPISIQRLILRLMHSLLVQLYNFCRGLAPFDSTNRPPELGKQPIIRDVVHQAGSGEKNFPAYRYTYSESRLQSALGALIVAGTFSAMPGRFAMIASQPIHQTPGTR